MTQERQLPKGFPILTPSLHHTITSSLSSLLPPKLPALIARYDSSTKVILRLMKAYMCVICGYVYEEEKGDPGSGIAPGTRWEDVPLSWRCPDCGAGKEDFEMVEV